MANHVNVLFFSHACSVVCVLLFQSSGKQRLSAKQRRYAYKFSSIINKTGILTETFNYNTTVSRWNNGEKWRSRQGELML